MLAFGYKYGMSTLFDESADLLLLMCDVIFLTQKLQLDTLTQ